MNKFKPGDIVSLKGTRIPCFEKSDLSDPENTKLSSSNRFRLSSIRISELQNYFGIVIKKIRKEDVAYPAIFSLTVKEYYLIKLTTKVKEMFYAINSHYLKKERKNDGRI